MTSSETVEVSVSTGPLDRPGSLRRVALPARDLANALAAHLNGLPPGGHEQHWTPATFKGNYRNKDNWQGACGVALDFDYYDAAGNHVELPDSVRTRLLAAGTDGVLPGSLFHLTRRGFRVVVLFEGVITSREARSRLGAGAAAIVADSLAQLALGPGPAGGLREDEGKTGDRACAMFVPRAEVDGVVRDSEVIVLRAKPYSFTALNEAYDRRMASAVVEASPPPPRASAASVEDAVRCFNAEHPLELPKSGGTCPACGHNDCFGEVPESNGRWSCFSSDHAARSGSCGIAAPGGGCWTGDALDLAAHAAGRPRFEYLRDRGYLPENGHPPATKPPGSASQAGVSSPSPVTARRVWRPFPVDALPDPLRSYVRGKAGALRCDPVLVALPCLSVLGGAIGNSHSIRLKPGWAEPPVIWSGIVCESGSLKSPAYDAALDPVRRRQQAEFRRHEENERAFEAKKTRFKMDLQEWRRGGCKGEPPTPIRPPQAKRILVSDTTVEALAERLESAPRGLLLAREELSGWFRSFGEYKRGRGGDEAQWLTMYGARLLIVDRKTGDHATIQIPRAAVSITGTIQPAVLYSVLGREHFESGLAARFLLAWPPRTTKTWSDETVAPEVLDAYDTLVGRLLALEPLADATGAPLPVEVGLNDEAQKLWIDFYNRHGRRQADAEGDDAAMLAKIEGTAARLSLIIYVIRCVGDEGASLSLKIDADSVREGIRLAEWLADEAERIYDEFRVSPAERARREIVSWVTRYGGRVTARDLSRGPRAYRDQVIAQRALEDLVRDGYGTWEDSEPDVVGGRPTTYFVLHPSLRESSEHEAATATKPPETSLSDEVSSPDAGTNGVLP